MKDMLGLQFQLDEIDYRAKNFVHADMSPTEFAQDMTKRGDGMVSMFSRLMGLVSQPKVLKREKAKTSRCGSFAEQQSRIEDAASHAEQFENMDAQLAGLNDRSGRSTLLTERNGKAFEVLGSQLKDGKKKIGIFYGAGHLIDMDKRLLQDFKAVRGSTTWLTAWKLTE